MFNKFRILYNDASDGSDGGGDGTGDQGTGSLLGGSTGDTGGDTSNTGESGAGDSGDGGFSFNNLVGDDGNFVDGWTDKLPEEMREHKNHYQKFRNPLQALESTRNLQQLLGKKGNAVVIPTADSDEETKSAFREKMGIPEQAGDYDIRKPEDLPEGVGWDDEKINGFKDLAHEIGLTPQQVEKLVQYDTAGAIASGEASDAQMVAAEERIYAEESKKLRDAWGDKFDSNKALAERAALTAGYSDEDINSNPIFRNADFVKTLATFGGLMSEDTLAKGTNGGASQSAKAQAMDIINNDQNQYYNRYWAGDEAIGKMVRGLMQGKG